MSLFKDRYRVETTRLPHWDYAGDGWYFVTICTRERACFLGEIMDAEMAPSALGNIVNDEWERTGLLRPNVTLSDWQVMPNHFHGIIGVARVEAKQPLRASTLQPNSLGSIIGQFKQACTRRIWDAGYGFGWQPRFYDRIIRDEREMERARLYVRNNPARWAEDKHNPANW